MKATPKQTVRYSFIIWILSIALFFFSAYTESVKLLITFLITGLLSYLAGMLALNALTMPKKKKGKRSYFFLRLIFLPFSLIWQTVNPPKLIKNIKKNKLKFKPKKLILKAGKLFLIGLLMLPVWLAGYAGITYGTGYFTGVLNFPTTTVGHSMEPTIEDKSTIKTYGYNKISSLFHKPQRGDIIVFQTGNTTGEGKELVQYVKRVVGTPGDTIEIKDGFLYLNGKILEEPYIKRARSTFGNDFLPSCEKATVPDRHVFALGDNRTRSKDSREIGFISYSDIDRILPLSRQDKYKDNWRDTSHDAEKAGLPSLDKEKYYKELNQIRKNNGLTLLERNKKLEEAAKLRAEYLIEQNNLKDQDYNYQDAQADAGYYNTTFGEISTSGYYNTEELATYWLEYDTKESILNPDFQETGVALIIGKIDGCETQVIVQEFGGYIPPNYKQSEIDSWKNTLSQLKEIYPSWADIKNYPTTYQKNKQKADRILEIIQLRISRIEQIVSRMESNQWLTSEEKKYINQNKALYEEQQSIAKELNNQVWK